MTMWASAAIECAACGSVVARTGSNHRYCSRDCKEGRTPDVVAAWATCCEHCGGPLSGRRGSRFCSVKCRNRSFYEKNPERWPSAEERRQRYESDDFDPRRVYLMKLQYGMTPGDYREMSERQGGVCAICNAPCSTGRRLAIDHDHVTGKVRALLCARCNSMLGYAIDNPALLTVGAAYLEAHRG